MNETELDPWVANETWVTYIGNSRKDKLGNGFKFKVVQANRTSAAVDAGIYGVQWAAKGAWKVVPAPTEDLDEIFSNAAGGPRAQLISEIERLTARLSELKTALRVIDSL